MTFDQFKNFVMGDQDPPSELAPLLRALLCDARGDWDGGHKIAQEIESSSAAWVHAYFHRREGDIGNARYWYERAGRSECRASLAEEWDDIARHLLQE